MCGCCLRFALRPLPLLPSPSPFIIASILSMTDLSVSLIEPIVPGRRGRRFTPRGKRNGGRGALSPTAGTDGRDAPEPEEASLLPLLLLGDEDEEDEDEALDDEPSPPGWLGDEARRDLGEKKGRLGRMYLALRNGAGLLAATSSLSLLLSPRPLPSSSSLLFGLLPLLPLPQKKAR